MDQTLKLSNSKYRINPKLILLIVIVLLQALAFMFLNIKVIDAIQGLPSFISFFINKFLWPDFSNISSYIPAVIDTVLFAIVATYISTALALLCGLLMSEVSNPIAPLRLITRATISFIRNIPILVWASLLVYAFGIGEIVGLLALIVATIGFLSRSYSDSINEVAQSKLEALIASGANYGQLMFHGLLPNMIPSLVNWTLFAFEINIRASTILGMVGAGGIGLLIQTNIKLFRYREACSIIIIVVIIVLLTEYITNKLRTKLG